MLHRRDEDLQAMRDAIAWIEARRGGLVTSLNYGHMVDACVALERAGEARRHAARLLLRARLLDRLGEAEGCRAMARLALQSRDERQTRRWLQRADAAAEARDSPHERAKNLLTNAQVAVAWGRAADGLALAGRAAEAFDQLGMPAYLAATSSSAG
jgi:hypothetical protein